MLLSKKSELEASVYYNGNYYILVTFSGFSIYIMDLKKGYKVLPNDLLDEELGYYAKVAPIKSEQIKVNLATVDKFTQKIGISGGHNANVFYNVVKDKNLKIIKEIPTNVRGIIYMNIKYLRSILKLEK